MASSKATAVTLTQPYLSQTLKEPHQVDGASSTNKYGAGIYTCESISVSVPMKAPCEIFCLFKNKAPSCVLGVR